MYHLMDNNNQATGIDFNTLIEAMKALDHCSEGYYISDWAGNTWFAND